MTTSTDSGKTRPDQRPQVPAEISRAWLLISARETDQFDRGLRSRADQIILDLEDGVDPGHRAEALQDVIDWFARGGNGWVRINEHETEFWAAEIAALKGSPGLRGVVLPKTEHPEQITDTHERLGGATPVMALVESALGIENAVSIARAPGTFRLAFGSGDYRRDTGAAATALAMAYPRSRLVDASAIAGLTGPIDGPTVSKSHPILREQSETAVSHGMTGKLCLDTDQLPVINEEFSPPVSDVEWARDFIDEFNARGRVVRDGSDLPRLHRAERIDSLARAFGIDP